MATSSMEVFARIQIGSLAERLEKDLHAAAQNQDEEAVHHIRVSIRRFVQGITVFAQYVPANWSKKVRRQLRRVMRRSSKVRDLDIALVFLKKHRFPEEILANRRERAGLKLAAALSSSKWRTRLSLERS